MRDCGLVLLDGLFRARVALPQLSGRYVAGCWGTALVMHSWRTALVVGRNIHNFHTG